MDLNSLINSNANASKSSSVRWRTRACSDNRKRAERSCANTRSEDLLEKWRALETTRKQLDDNRELATSRDVEIAAMADDEIPELQKRLSDLEHNFQIALLPVIRRKSATRSWKFAPGRAAAKPPSSPPIFTGCIIATQKRRD